MNHSFPKCMAPWSLLLSSTALLLPACVVTPFDAIGVAPRIAAPPSRPAAASLVPLSAPANEPHEIRASHLLIAYQGAMRAAPSVLRSKPEALIRAQEAFTKAKAGAEFKQLAAEYSDEPGAAASGGDLGKFKRDRVVPEFGKAAFALRPGELSNVVESPFGYHVILRTE